MMSIQAAVCYERGEPLVVESLNLEDPRKNEVRVRLKAAAICHSDIANLRGHWAGGVRASQPTGSNSRGLSGPTL